VVVAGRLVAARADQEVEVGAAVGLEHMVDVEPGVAACRGGGPGGCHFWRRWPCSSSSTSIRSVRAGGCCIWAKDVAGE